MALNPLVSLFGRLVARSARISGTGQTDGRTDGRTDRPSTVTLVAHARRGLIIYEWATAAVACYIRIKPGTEFELVSFSNPMPTNH